MNWLFKKKNPNLSFSKNIKKTRPHSRLFHRIKCQKGYATIVSVLAIIGIETTVATVTTIATVIYVAYVVASIAYAIYNIVAQPGKSSQDRNSSGTNYGRDTMSSGHLLNTRASSEPIPIPYGECRLGGNLVYISATGTTNEYLHMVMTLGEGPVDSISTGELLTLDVAPGGTGWKKDDTITGASSGETCIIFEVVTTLKYIITGRTGAFTLGEILSNGTNTADQGATYPTVTTVDMIWLDDKHISYYGTKATYEFFSGTSSQTVCATLQVADPLWDDAMRYTAYIYVKLTYDETLYASMPQVTVKFKGRKLYDTRNGTTVYSNNPGLVAYDFLTNDRYSIGIPSSAFDTTMINDAATWADTNTYTFNGSILKYQTFLDNLDDILKNFRAGIIWSEGEYKLIVYEYDTPIMTLTEDEIVADSFRISIPGIPETPNRVVLNYIDAVDNYLSKQRIIEDGNAVLSYDKEERDFTLDLIGTTNATQAEKLGSYYVERNRLNYQFSFSCAAKTLALEPLDMVTITHYLPGWAEAILRVVDVAYTGQGDYVKLTVVDDASTLYDDVVNVATHNAYQTNLPVPSNFPSTPVTIENVPGLAADPQVTYQFQLLASNPVGPTEGQTWYNTTDHHYRGYNGSSVVDLD